MPTGKIVFGSGQPTRPQEATMSRYGGAIIGVFTTSGTPANNDDVNVTITLDGTTWLSRTWDQLTASNAAEGITVPPHGVVTTTHADGVVSVMDYGV